jgi:hypothetical protein
MLVRIPEEEVLDFFRMLEATVRESGILYVSDGKIRVIGDRDSWVMPLSVVYKGVEFPSVQLTRSIIESLKDTYSDFLLSRYRLPDLVIIKYELPCDVKYEFVFGSKSYLLT